MIIILQYNINKYELERQCLFLSSGMYMYGIQRRYTSNMYRCVDIYYKGYLWIVKSFCLWPVIPLWDIKRPEQETIPI